MAGPNPLATEAGDGSMETILASIRRIIREDEAASAPAPALAASNAADQPEPDAEEDELLVLEPSMIVQAPQVEEPRMTQSSSIEQLVQPAPAAAPPPSAAALAAALFDDAPLPAPVAVTPAPVAVVPEAALPRPTHALLDAPDDGLLAPQARAAAAQSLAALQQAARPEPGAPGLRLLRSGGPTIEDMVRDELRVQLKDWLDANLPDMVERLVAREIERLARPD